MVTGVLGLLSCPAPMVAHTRARPVHHVAVRPQVEELCCHVCLFPQRLRICAHNVHRDVHMSVTAFTTPFICYGIHGCTSRLRVTGAVNTQGDASSRVTQLQRLALLRHPFSFYSQSAARLVLVQGAALSEHTERAPPPRVMDKSSPTSDMQSILT